MVSEISYPYVCLNILGVVWCKQAYLGFCYPYNSTGCICTKIEQLLFDNS